MVHGDLHAHGFPIMTFFGLNLFHIQPPAFRQTGFQFTNKATKAQGTTGGPERFRNVFRFTQLMSGGEGTTGTFVSYHRDFSIMSFCSSFEVQSRS